MHQEEIKVGDEVLHQGNPLSAWRVEAIRGNWAFAAQNGSRQWFYHGVLHRKAAPAPKPSAAAPKSVEQVARKKKDSVADDVARLLAEAASIAQCWEVLALSGLDVQEVRDRIGHLSNGLQRMGIGNRLRKLHREGLFDPTLIHWTPQGFVLRLAS